MKHLASVVLVMGMAASANAQPIQWGQNGDTPVPRDYDGDGYADIAVWRPSDGNWYIRGRAAVQLGGVADTPVPADFDGDYRPDFVVWNRSTGNWLVKNSVTGATRGPVQWGAPGDIPVPGDFDADGRADFVVYRPSNGYWYIRNSVTDAMTSVQWGQAGDKPLVGDYDGLPGDDFTVWRPGTGEWFALGGTSRKYRKSYLWGQQGDVPSTAQFQCSRKAGQTIFRPGSPAQWWMYGKPIGFWGEPNDVPVPANYSGDYAADIAIWRPSDGNWWIAENQSSPRCKSDWDGAATAIHRAKEDVHGITVVAIKNGQVVFQYGAGMANFNNPATPDIPWQLASISKLFIATAALQQIDAGTLALDAPAGTFNPHNYQMPTLRHHVTHTSSLITGSCEAATIWEQSHRLADITDPCLTTANPNYWFPMQPGTVYNYTNVGAAWVARRVEQVTNMDFDAYTKNRIFMPLGMTSTGWFASDFYGRSIAMPFNAPDQAATLLHISPYASGNLRSSALDLARFMSAWTNDGVANNGTRILAPGRVAWALSPMSTISPHGFLWFRRWIAGRDMWMHNGQITGICTRLEIDTAKKEGLVILTNGNCDQANGHMDAIQEVAWYTLDQQ